MAVDDFNRDGAADVVMADGSVYLGTGDGSLRFLASASLGGVAVATGDFNHDGISDLAVAVECAPTGCSSGGQLLIALGNGDGTFQAPTTLPSGGFYAESVTVADFQRDHLCIPSRNYAVRDPSFAKCAKEGILFLFRYIVIIIVMPTVNPPSGKRGCSRSS